MLNHRASSSLASSSLASSTPPISLDRVFRALADPSRRAMVDRLSRGPAAVTELAEPHDMSLPAVVQHLQVLEDSGVILTEKRGRVRMCRIVPRSLGLVEQWVAERRALWEHHLDRLGDFLAEEDRNTSKAGKTSQTSKTGKKRKP